MTPRQWQYFVMGALVVGAVILQGVVVARVPLPGPPLGLVLAVVIAVGLGGGSNAGAVAGFTGGVLLDLLPPAQTTLGVTALVLLLAGALAGRVPDPRGLAPAQLAAVAGGLSAAAWVTAQALFWVLGDPVAPVSWFFIYVAGTTLLCLVVVPAATWAIRRIGIGHRRRRRTRRPTPAGPRP
jgi:rod shape-determining protein MreD